MQREQRHANAGDDRAYRVLRVQPVAQYRHAEPDREEHLHLDHDRREPGRHAEAHAEEQQPELEHADREPVGHDHAPWHARPRDEEHERHRREEEAQCDERERRDFAQPHLDRNERETPERDDDEDQREVAGRETSLHRRRSLASSIGARLEDVTSFAKYLGGSSANTAFGCARLGLRAGLISRVGDDAMGRFLVETIAREGCDTSHVGVDPTRLTGAVVLGIEDKDTFPLIFLRENCADMAIGEAEIEEHYIAQARALLITGTHFSTRYIDGISERALERARANDVRTVLDIDYRPVLWGLTKRGDGETRYIASDTVTAHLQRLLPKFDLVIGTIEEFNIAGGSTDIMQSLAAIRRISNAVLVVKRGAMGCAVIDGAVPRSLDAAFNGRGVQVEVLNVLGAGDAFSSGFLSGWVRGEDYDACARYANACGALVVSRHGCAPAMPTRVELDYFLANAERIPRPDQDVALTRLHRVTAPRTPHPEVLASAFDHRRQFLELAQPTGADE